VRFGIHLPQGGRAAGPDAIRRAAVQAEELGFDDVWVSDHLAIPADAPYPPAFLYEPVVALTWAAAATTRIGLGTSVLVLPYRHPLHLAKELATLDQLSAGRLTVGVGAGWLAEEFASLDVPFAERGRRTDEAIDAIRACWGEQPVTFDGETVHIKDMKVVPTPERHVPIWVGGTAAPALRRAVERGDGWQGTFMNAADTAPLLEVLRERKPDRPFTLSMRTAWDPLRDDRDELRRELDAFREAGIDHLLVSPRQGDADGWLRSAAASWDLLASVR
jgi:probable F420-dependent oxidoreductase